MLLKTRTFKKGGIHPHDHKKLSRDKAIQPIAVPETVTVPMSMHTGKPADVIVEKGAIVTAGQKIGEVSGFISAAIHAPISGEVKSIEVKQFLGRPTTMVTISQTEDTPKVDYSEEEDWEGYSAEQIRNLVKEAGIVGMGGAMFPTHVKLAPPPDLKVDTLILNGVECEPYLTCDERVMLEYTDGVIMGAKIMAKALGVDCVIIGIEKNKPEAIKKVSEAAKRFGGCIKVQPLKMQYPQGGEKQLIAAVLDREVPSGKLPAHVGVVVSNVHTSLAVKEAVVNHKPLIERVVTLTGGAVKNPGNYLVRIGTTFREVVEVAGGLKTEPAKIISGGPMMGQTMSDLDVPVLKGTSGILLLTKKELPPMQKDIWMNCVHCSYCIEVCPQVLNPSLLGILGESRRWREMERNDVNDCMECGSCAFVCPSNRPLVHWMKLGKAMIRQDWVK